MNAAEYDGPHAACVRAIIAEEAADAAWRAQVLAGWADGTIALPAGVTVVACDE